MATAMTRGERSGGTAWGARRFRGKSKSGQPSTAAKSGRMSEKQVREALMYAYRSSPHVRPFSPPLPLVRALEPCPEVGPFGSARQRVT